MVSLGVHWVSWYGLEWSLVSWCGLEQQSPVLQWANEAEVGHVAHLSQDKCPHLLHFTEVKKIRKALLKMTQAGRKMTMFRRAGERYALNIYSERESLVKTHWELVFCILRERVQHVAWWMCQEFTSGWAAQLLAFSGTRLKNGIQNINSKYKFQNSEWFIFVTTIRLNEHINFV